MPVKVNLLKATQRPIKALWVCQGTNFGHTMFQVWAIFSDHTAPEADTISIHGSPIAACAEVKRYATEYDVTYVLLPSVMAALNPQQRGAVVANLGPLGML